MREGDRHALDDFGNRGRLGPFRLQEFQPRGGGEKQVAHLDDCTGIRGGGPDIGNLAAGNGNHRTLFRTLLPAGNRQLGDRADGGQRFAAKPERADIIQRIGNFRGAVTPDRKLQIGR
ncbi:hypothetical protein D3C72_1501880 [compost metagenome]